MAPPVAVKRCRPAAGDRLTIMRKKGFGVQTAHPDHMAGAAMGGERRTHGPRSWPAKKTERSATAGLPVLQGIARMPVACRKVPAFMSAAASRRPKNGGRPPGKPGQASSRAFRPPRASWAASATGMNGPSCPRMDARRAKAPDRRRVLHGSPWVRRRERRRSRRTGKTTSTSAGTETISHNRRGGHVRRSMSTPAKRSAKAARGIRPC